MPKVHVLVYIFIENDSLRATAATRMYDMGIDEQLICEKTGERNEII